MPVRDDTAFCALTAALTLLLDLACAAAALFRGFVGPFFVLDSIICVAVAISLGPLPSRTLTSQSLISGMLARASGCLRCAAARAHLDVHVDRPQTVFFRVQFPMSPLSKQVSAVSASPV